MDSESTVAKGQEAARLMDSSVLRESLEAIKRKQMTAFASSQPSDSDKRETAYFTLRAIEELESQLEKVRGDGVYEAEKAKRRK